MENLKTKSDGIVYPKVRLIQDHILTTLNVKKVTAGGIILSSREDDLILNRQTVVAAGPNSVAKVGDEVEVNPERFPTGSTPAKNDIGPDKRFRIPPTETIDGVEYLYISTREIKWIYTK